MNHTKTRFLRLGATVLALAAWAATPSLVTAMAPQDASRELLMVSAPASYLGVNIRDIDEHSARMLGLKSAKGVEVTAVDHDAPAGKAGMRLRDVILTVDDKPVTSAAQFRETMRGFPPDKEVHLGVIRDAKPMKFSIRLADRVKLQQKAFERHFIAPMPQIGNSFSGVSARQQELSGEVQDEDAVPMNRPYRIGAELDAIGPQLATYFGIKDGTGMLVKNVLPDSPAAAAGLQAGDVILKLNDEPVSSPFDWMRAMQSVDDKPIQLTIVRNRKTEVITVNPPKTQASLDWPELPPVADFHFDEKKFNAGMDALRDALKANPALNKDAIQKALDEAHSAQFAPPDGEALNALVKDSLAKSGISPDGHLSPELQEKIDDAMQDAKKQMEKFDQQFPSLQPY